MLAARAVESVRHPLEHADEPDALRRELARGGRKAHGVEPDLAPGVAVPDSVTVSPSQPSQPEMRRE